MEGLLLAHDRIATTTDRSPATVLTAGGSVVQATTDDGSIASNKAQNQNAHFVNNNVIKVFFLLHFFISLYLFDRSF